MYLIPLNQLESVELVVHALRAAGGEADCSVCPARKVCMKQCLTIAAAVGDMLSNGTLPSLGAEPEEDDAPETTETTAPTAEARPSAANKTPSNHLKVIK